MSSIGPVSSNIPIPPAVDPVASTPPPTATPSTPQVPQALPVIDPSIVVGQHGHGGGAHKGAVQNTQNQQTIIQQQQQAYVFKSEELKEINQLVAEETQPEKEKEEEDPGADSKKQKQPSMKTRWKRASNARLKI